MISNTGIGILGVLLLLGCFLILNSCRSKDIDLETYEKTKIHFGGGGGFTGQSFEFCLLEQGMLYSVNSLNKEYSEPMLIKRSVAKALINKINDLNALNLAYNEPGNIYKYIKTSKLGMEDAKLVWGDPNLTVDPKVIEIYNELIALTKDVESDKK